MLVNSTPDGAHTRIMKDFETKCYAPLKLLEASQDTFLETRFELEDNRLKYWLKNDNEGGERKIWRYQHYMSHTPFLQKQSVLTACLRKIQKMSSHPDTLYKSGMAKTKEFQNIGYPLRVLKGACTYLAASTGTKHWLDVRDDM